MHFSLETCVFPIHLVGLFNLIGNPISVNSQELRGKLTLLQSLTLLETKRQLAVEKNKSSNLARQVDELKKCEAIVQQLKSQVTAMSSEIIKK